MYGDEEVGQRSGRKIRLGQWKPVMTSLQTGHVPHKDISVNDKLYILWPWSYKVITAEKFLLLSDIVAIKRSYRSYSTMHYLCGDTLPPVI